MAEVRFELSLETGSVFQKMMKEYLDLRELYMQGHEGMFISREYYFFLSFLAKA